MLLTKDGSDIEMRAQMSFRFHGVFGICDFVRFELR